MGKGRISIGPDGAGNQKQNTDVENSADRAKAQKVNGMMMNSTLGIHGSKKSRFIIWGKSREALSAALGSLHFLVGNS